jgi:hypothetical protein
MKLLTLLPLLLFTLFLSPLSSQDFPENVPASSIQIVGTPTPSLQGNPQTTISFEEDVYDFGTVTEGEIVTKVFAFTNTGTEPLIIYDAKGSCGCTVPAKPLAPIAPGETAAITVQFNTKNKKGMRNQRVTLSANVTPVHTFIYLTGEVIPDPNQQFDNEVNTIAELSSTEAKLPKDCFAIYPNPTAEVLKLRMDEDNFGKSAEVAIFSLEGQLMARRQVTTIVEDIEFDVSHYPAGTYHARVSVGKTSPVSQCFVVIN